MGAQLGTVKWYKADKGYGFIVLDEGGEAFVHHSVIRPSGQVLHDGQRVSCDVVSSPKGGQAANVEVVGD